MKRALPYQSRSISIYATAFNTENRRIVALNPNNHAIRIGQIFPPFVLSLCSIFAQNVSLFSRDAGVMCEGEKQ